MTKKSKNANTQKPATVVQKKGETRAETLARALVGPNLRHGIICEAIASKMIGKVPENPGFDDYGNAIKTKAAALQKGDKGMANDLLTAQAITLDSMFTELTRRAVMNLGDCPLAAERYARLAFKAQSNCRASLEALGKIHQTRVQTVRHVHVNEGGQAVVADNFHHHEGGSKNAETSKQPHATGTTGESPALLSPDTQGNGVPITGNQKARKVQDARRQGQRRTKGQS